MPDYIDVSAAVHSKAGLGRYASSLARALVDEEPGRLALFYNRSARAQLPEYLEAVPSRTVHAGYKPWRMAVWLGHLFGLSFRRLVPDARLFHATEHLLPPLGGVPTVLTVHDMVFKLFPQHQKRLNFWYLNAAMPLYCRRADAIITVSDWSKRDLVQHYGVDPAKVTVVYEAAAEEFVPAAPQAVDLVRSLYQLPQQFAIHVGTIEPRKNLARLLEALYILRRDGVAIPLYLAGSKGWLYEGFFRRLEELRLQDLVHCLGFVPSAHLPALYSAATIAVIPTVYEGFGLPVLEAMACGTPVVCSSSSSLPEVGGAAARYFDPYSDEEIADALTAVWLDAGLRSEMQARGLARAQQYSWRVAARQTLAVYDRVLA